MSYGLLSSKEISETLARLRNRINDRFPGSGLSKLAGGLRDIVREAQTRSNWISKPNIGLRIVVGIFVILVLGTTVLGIAGLGLNFRTAYLSDFVQMLEAGANDVILLGGAIYFLVTIEARIKRKKTMKVLHQLRGFAHLIDMHQLLKDPARLTELYKGTPTSPPKEKLDVFLLSRYLDYCSELLSIVSKVAALYAQHFEDRIVLTAVDEIENLTNGLSSKIWQKIMINNQA